MVTASSKKSKPVRTLLTLTKRELARAADLGISDAQYLELYLDIEQDLVEERRANFEDMLAEKIKKEIETEERQRLEPLVRQDFLTKLDAGERKRLEAEVQKALATAPCDPRQRTRVAQAWAEAYTRSLQISVACSIEAQTRTTYKRVHTLWTCLVLILALSMTPLMDQVGVVWACATWVLAGVLCVGTHPLWWYVDKDWDDLRQSHWSQAQDARTQYEKALLATTQHDLENSVAEFNTGRRYNQSAAWPSARSMQKALMLQPTILYQSTDVNDGLSNLLLEDDHT